jgi:hypothetical protein
MCGERRGFFLDRGLLGHGRCGGRGLVPLDRLWLARHRTGEHRLTPTIVILPEQCGRSPLQSLPGILVSLTGHLQQRHRARLLCKCQLQLAKTRPSSLFPFPFLWCNQLARNNGASADVMDRVRCYAPSPARREGPGQSESVGRGAAGGHRTEEPRSWDRTVIDLMVQRDGCSNTRTEF